MAPPQESGISFTLSPSQSATRAAASQLARNVLFPARQVYLSHPASSPDLRFQATRPAYATATGAGLIKAQISPLLGGSASSLVEAAILVEECYAVEPSAALTIFATGLGLTPLNIVAGQTDEKGRERLKEFLKPFLSTSGLESGTGNSSDGAEGGQQQHAPLASLVFSEPTGVANVLEPGGRGFQTTARFDPSTDEWIINGEKMWATNCAGWDFKGCDLACVVCRDITSGPDLAENEQPIDRVMILLVTRADLDKNGEGSFEVLKHIEMPGHTSVSGPHVRYHNVRVPAKNVLCPPGQGAQVAFGAFDASAVLVGAMGVGIMRAAFDAALGFAKRDDRGGAVPLLERQAVADLLSGIKMNTEAGRALTWKAAWVMDHAGEETEDGVKYEARRELALGAKVWCSEAAVRAVTDAVNAVGITAYNVDQPFAELLNNAMVLPIFDGGNVGIRRRHLQQILLSPGYDAWSATYGPSEGK